MRTRRRARRSLGFTLVELMIVIATIGVLSTMAIPGYSQLKARARRAEFVTEIKLLEQTYLNYVRTTGHIPGSPSYAGGIEYVYTPLNPSGSAGTQKDLDWTKPTWKELASAVNAPVDRSRMRYFIYGYTTPGTVILYIYAYHDFDGDGTQDYSFFYAYGPDIDHMSTYDYNFESME